MHPEHTSSGPVLRAFEVHQPTPITSAVAAPAPVVPVPPTTVPTVASVVLPDGRIITGYAVGPVQPEPVTAKPAVARAAVNVALGGVGFLAVCGGLLMLTTFITALTALITQLVTLAVVLFGGFIAAQVLTAGRRSRGGTTVNIRRAVIKRNHFHH
ncbi:MULTISPECIES: hypothetical protein [Streptomyces]|uniref:Integral membrane protein n=1 Tax=Streptomyces doudnae TaxID=3075536 RepID=A0ABD5EJY5_9ACTN|nr:MULTISPECIES: hypothetical protein [unclassified Streptomyces]MDT0434064.1 hypothetical protein [Streptomyces sp. DSM 41981]MYQ65006.1 hypothetical protein [Streptomyces sp. SID4950]SCD90557.1 hypothetical protein GA0115242_116829 [Streptomyces sp. SolWspMP-5a-2]